MSAINEECRFCLKVFSKEEKYTIIDNEIRKQFKNFTQMKLSSSAKLSKVICELCLRSLQMAHLLKNQFIENQQKLENHCNYDDQIDLNTDPFFAPLYQETAKDENGECSGSSSVKIAKIHSVKQEPEEILINYEPNVSTINMYNYDDQSQDSKNFNDDDEEKKIKLKCFHCELKFASTFLRRRHILVLHMKQQFPCVVQGCDVKIKRKDFFKEHFKKYHRNLSAAKTAELIKQSKSVMPVYENQGLRLE
ncbi:hypothetical protein PVAND_006894 [Polypedilum vanderplanki]|uniref:ZAD domain-containing protein n=1 Tax=Polypedilum vanderplanki TaxID=319348 RepID=A0A9J6C550_POLVA|nr:hypothetical protein PVAND_006894 [Polypedilum vanderplanki]